MESLNHYLDHIRCIMNRKHYDYQSLTMNNSGYCWWIFNGSTMVKQVLYRLKLPDVSRINHEKLITTCTGSPYIWSGKQCFPVDVPLNQSNDKQIPADHVQEPLFLIGKTMFSCSFFLKPIRSTIEDSATLAMFSCRCFSRQLRFYSNVSGNAWVKNDQLACGMYHYIPFYIILYWRNM